MENIRFILDHIEYASHHDILGFLYLLDFEKAFHKLQ